MARVKSSVLLPRRGGGKPSYQVFCDAVRMLTVPSIVHHWWPTLRLRWVASILLMLDTTSAIPSHSRLTAARPACPSQKAQTGASTRSPTNRAEASRRCGRGDLRQRRAICAAAVKPHGPDAVPARIGPWGAGDTRGCACRGRAAEVWDFDALWDASSCLRTL